jgi:enamine deaminase RidA (YjgF/YER057c/UK114 family)
MSAEDTPAPADVQYLEPIGWQKTRSFSPVVISRGGATVWLAGQTTLIDLDGNDIAGKFEEQARTIFALMNRSLERAGGPLANLVTMTVFINDPRNGDRFVEIRREFFEEGKYPASALVTVSNFARPGCVIEIQGVAVV